MLLHNVVKNMTQTITLKIWNEQEQKVSNVKVNNVLWVRFESVFQSIGFFGSDIEILINPDDTNIEFSFTDDKSRVFITITEANNKKTQQ